MLQIQERIYEKTQVVQLIQDLPIKGTTEFLFCFQYLKNKIRATGKYGKTINKFVLKDIIRKKKRQTKYNKKRESVQEPTRNKYNFSLISVKT